MHSWTRELLNLKIIRTLTSASVKTTTKYRHIRKIVLPARLIYRILQNLSVYLSIFHYLFLLKNMKRIFEDGVVHFFKFIYLALPTRAGSPQQHMPITVGPFT